MLTIVTLLCACSTKVTTEEWQQVPVACEAIEVESDTQVNCIWGGEKQTSYECPIAIHTQSTESCYYVECVKERNISVLLRVQYN